MKTTLRSSIFILLTFLTFFNQILAYTITGSVSDQITGKPITNALISFFDKSRTDSNVVETIDPVFTGEDGIYSLDLAEGVYFVFVFHEEYQSFEQSDIVINSNMTLDFTLFPVVVPPIYDNIVSGVVKNKNNNLPVEYASISLIAANNLPYNLNYYTNSDGYFEISNIVPGTYTLSVWESAYQQYFHSIELNITEDTKLTELEIFLEPLKTYTNIKIKVFSTGSNGQQVLIPDAEVYLYSGFNKYYGVTNNQGELILDQITGGTFEIMVYALGYVQTFGSAEVSSDNQTIEVKLETLQLGRITGRIFADSDQAPVPGAYIYAYPVESMYGGWNNYTAAADSNGQYVLELPKGRYIITCSYLNGYNFYYSVTEFYDNARTMEEAEIISVGMDSVTSDIDFGLDITIPEVIEAKITGKILASDGKSLKYAELIVSDDLNKRYEYLKVEVDAEGNYSASTWLLKGLNELVIGAFSDGYEQQFYNEKRSWYEADVVKADLSSGENIIQDINFVLTPYNFYSNYSISGRVVDESGDPVLGAFVEAYGDNGIVGMSVSDSSGNYYIPDLFEGKYIIAYSAGGYLPGFYKDATEWENADLLDLTGDLKGIDFILTKTPDPGSAGVIIGTVTYNDNTPVVGARVILSTVNDKMIAADVTNTKGEFQLKGIIEADYYITVSKVNHPSYKSSLSFDMKESNSNYYNISLITTDVKDISANIKPETYNLKHNYPNPFNPLTTIEYEIPTAGMVQLKIYDILGNEIVTLVNEYKDSGKYQVKFNANELSSGSYIFQLKSGNFIQSRKMILLK